MKKFALLLALAWIVVNSSVSLRYEPHAQRYEVRETTITIDDYVVGNYRTKDIAEDIAEALNEAHERRRILEGSPFLDHSDPVRRIYK